MNWKLEFYDVSVPRLIHHSFYFHSFLHDRLANWQRIEYFFQFSQNFALFLSFRQIRCAWISRSQPDLQLYNTNILQSFNFKQWKYYFSSYFHFLSVVTFSGNQGEAQPPRMFVFILFQSVLPRIFHFTMVIETSSIADCMIWS